MSGDDRAGLPRRLAATAAATTAAATFLLVGPVPGAAAQDDGRCAPAEQQVVDAEPWAQRRLAADRAWAVADGNVVVGVLDTGVSAAAPALAGAVLPGTDLAGGRADADCSGHGTFLAGLLAARPDGRSAFAGVAPGATLLPVRVVDEFNRVEPDRVAAGITAAVDGGARVIAVGVVTTVSTPALEAAVADAVARDVLVVASVSVQESGQRAFPASLPGVLAVAPVGPDGPPKNGAMGAAPALAAPAEKLVGLAPSGGGHRSASGPELAVGFVAGAAALVRDYRPQLSAAEVAQRLLATADSPSGPLPNPLVGYGVVDPTAAVTSVFGAEERDRAAAAVPVVVPRAPVADPLPAERALWFSGGLLLVALVLGSVVGVVALGRRRGGDSPTPAAGNSR
ncbi:S8 family serine peptidase [Actinokineospora bangkokensis]|uniref:Peptidase S8/S53 domain-containing protein n=1 Tax=Actinokineospora bangkokensis TaxID=1193682 RepID=A0A1Q9LMU7_9PSEU|nr:S8 family serine peptidase [Actinokineospora bangkokensis]OLR93350.1 hypothetical protein BJP25_17925 [Actinokineospora bangkokensis]